MTLLTLTATGGHPTAFDPTTITRITRAEVAGYTVILFTDGGYIAVQEEITDVITTIRNATEDAHNTTHSFLPEGRHCRGCDGHDTDGTPT